MDATAKIAKARQALAASTADRGRRKRRGGDFSSGFGGGAVINLHQIGERNLSVFLGGREARVAQQLLYGAQVGAVGQQMRGVGVAETVRVNGRIAVHQYAVELDDAAHSARGEPPAAMVQEDGALLERRAPLRQVAVQGSGGLGGERHLALLFPLAAHADPALGAIDMLQIWPYQ